ncbi:helix-turn-helix domain-containing protein [Mycobacterium riyadhense]|uniref:helix-turn-helix domain-containing protein n=1 Tax=Mycobacterium riyadhense TaxID=486698 RepID=UPI001EF9F059|nr:helix-turn-helix domain-containing protein [Mycobacterium riyadhense]
MPSFSCVLRWGLVGGAPVSRGSKGLGGSPIGEVATRYGTTRQSLDSWRTRFKQEGMAGLADRTPARPSSTPRSRH